MSRRSPSPSGRRRRARPARLAAVAILLALACAESDRDLYAVGDPALATLRNIATETVFLEGCSEFTFEMREDGKWLDAGQPVQCFWEGYARPVEPGDAHVTRFAAPGRAGTFRLRYLIGIGCSDSRPLGVTECEALVPTRTPPFRVVEVCEPSACGPALGMPSILCEDGSVGGPTGRCLRDPDGEGCGWEIRSCP